MQGTFHRISIQGAYLTVVGALPDIHPLRGPHSPRHTLSPAARLRSEAVFHKPVQSGGGGNFYCLLPDEKPDPVRGDRDGVVSGAGEGDVKGIGDR